MASRRGFGTVLQRSGRRGFYIAFPAEGQRIWRYAAPTRRAAQRTLARVEAMLAKGSPLADVMAAIFGEATGSRLTLRQLAPVFIEAREERVGAQTLKRDKQRLRRIIKDAPWSSKPVGIVRRQDIERWAEERRDRGRSGPTVNKEISIISRFFVWARQRGYVDTSPVRDVERYSEAGRGRIVHLTPEECRALLSAAEEEGPAFYAFVTAVLLTGARRSELLSLRWRDVDFVRRELTIQPESDKIRWGRTIPMAPDLDATLQTLQGILSGRKVVPIGFVFAGKGGGPIPLSTLRGMMDRTIARTAVPDDRKRIIGFHVFRHTAASLMASAGVPLQDVGRILGHRSTQTTLRYSHLYADVTRGAVDKLAGILSLGRVRGDDSAVGS